MSDIYFDKDINLEVLKYMKVGVIGYGNQGRAQGLNLRDSGIRTIIGLRDESSSKEKVIADGMDSIEISQCVRECDIICLMVPDQTMSNIYKAHIKRYLKPGKILLFSHGYNIHYKQIEPPSFVDVIMVAPSGPGYAVREEYKTGRGIPTLVAIHQDITGRAKDIALAYSKAIGGSRLCCFTSTFKEETETDLFGEQIILTGIIPTIINESYKVLLEANYSPMVAWFVTFYELRQIAELISKQGLDQFYKSVSDTAEYGGMTRSAELIDNSFKNNMKSILDKIQSGDFYREWKTESDGGYRKLTELRKKHQNSPINDITTKMLDILNKQKNDK